MKKWAKLLLISLTSFVVIFISANLYFHYWLQNNLPNYIKDKSPYNVSYKSLKIGFLKGDIRATQIKISNKNSNNQNVIGINGTLDSLYISNLGIYDALFNKRINSDLVKLTNPNLKITLAKPKDSAKEKKKNPFLLENVKITNGNIEIVKHNKSPFLSVYNLSLNIDNLELTEENVERKLPIVFDDYSIKGDHFNFFPDEVYQISAKNINAENGQMSVKSFALKPLMKYEDFIKKYPQKNLIDFSAFQMNFKDIQLKNNKISLSDIQFLQPDLVLFQSSSKPLAKKKTFTYVVDLQNVNFLNGNVKIIKNNTEKLKIEQVNAKISELLMDEESAKGKIPFQYKNYQISTGKLVFDAGNYYQIFVNQLNTNKNSLVMKNFVLHPKLSRAQFAKSIPTEKDWFDIAVNSTQISGIDFKFEENQPNVKVNQVLLNGVNAKIYRSKSPKDDVTRKKLYSELLRSIKFLLLIDNLNVRNSFLQYEEDKVDNNPAGKLMFSQFNLNAKNINSNKGFKNTLVPISINCQFIKASPMKVNWSFDTANLNDQFKISGTISDLPASEINDFVKPYLNTSVSGNISLLGFDFQGNNKAISGKMKLQHQDLKVVILDKETKKEKKLVSAIANMVVRTNSKDKTEDVDINTPRNSTKSFFNLFWKGIEEGLKKTLIGKNIENTEKSVKNTVKGVKKSSKEVKTTIKQESKKVGKFLQKVFKKKEKKDSI